MRSPYILLGLLVPLTVVTNGRRVAESRPSSQIVEEDYDETIRSLKLSSTERKEVFGDTTIIKRLRVTDCHSSISQQLEGRCKNENDQLKPNEAYRSDLAISLTLCSLASAMQNVPSDCEAWYRATYLGEQEATPIWKIWKSTSDARSPSARQTCLGALHRSPQDWTSYNQYLSDATLLCSALRADWQTNQAKELYANATMEKISLISLLKSNEEARREDQIRLSRDMSDGVKETRKNAESTSGTLELIQQELRRQEDVRTSMMTQLEQAMNGLINAADGVWDGIKGEGAEMAMSLVKDMRDSQAKMMMGLSQELRASLSSLAAQHGDSLEIHQRRLALDTEFKIAQLSDSFALLAGDTEGYLDVFNTKLAVASQEAVNLHGNIFAAAELVDDMHPSLFASAQSAQEIRDANNQTTASIHKARSELTTLEEGLTRVQELVETMGNQGKWTLFTPSIFSVSAFNIPKEAFDEHGLLGLAASVVHGLVRAALGLMGCMIQLLGLSLGILLSITTTVYAALHSRARLPIRRLFRRIETQLHNIADDLEEGDSKFPPSIEVQKSTKTPSTKMIFWPKPKPITCMKAIKEEEVEEDYSDKPAEAWAVVGMDDRYSGSSIRSKGVPRPRTRSGSAPP